MSNEHSRLLSYWLLVISTGIIIGVVVFLITEAIKSDAIGSVINKYFPKPTSADSNKKMSNEHAKPYSHWLFNTSLRIAIVTIIILFITAFLYSKYCDTPKFSSGINGSGIQTRKFTGYVGNEYGNFTLTFDSANKKVSGSYYYLRINLGKVFKLTGTMGQNYVELTEYDPSNKISGTCVLNTSDDKCFTGSMDSKFPTKGILPMQLCATDNIP